MTVEVQIPALFSDEQSILQCNILRHCCGLGVGSVQLCTAPVFVVYAVASADGLGFCSVQVG